MYLQTVIRPLMGGKSTTFEKMSSQIIKLYWILAWIFHYLANLTKLASAYYRKLVEIFFDLIIIKLPKIYFEDRTT